MIGGDGINDESNKTAPAPKQQKPQIRPGALLRRALSENPTTVKSAIRLAVDRQMVD